MLSTAFVALTVVMAPQSPWIVDAANRPGTHFTDLPYAIAAATTGDTIVVRAAQTRYSAFLMLGKALTIRGEGRIDANTTTWLAGATIGAVPPGSVFTIEGCSIDGLTLRDGSFALASCGAGPSRFERANVAMDHCSCSAGFSSLFTPPALALTDTTLVANACSFYGGLGWANVDFWTCQGSSAGSVAIAATNSNLILHDTSVTGGAWSSASWFYPGPIPSWCIVNYYPFDAIALTSSTIRVAGDATSTISPGIGGGGLAITADPTSRGTVHGTVTLASGVSPQIAVGAAPLPRLSIGGTELANREIQTSHPVTITVDGQIPGAPLWLAFSPTPTAPVDLGPIVLGEAMLPLSAFLATNALDNAGRFTTTIPGVLVPWLGTPVFGQAVVLDVAAMQFRMSNLDLRVFTF